MNLDLSKPTPITQDHPRSKRPRMIALSYPLSALALCLAACGDQGTLTHTRIDRGADMTTGADPQEAHHESADMSAPGVDDPDEPEGPSEPDETHGEHSVYRRIAARCEVSELGSPLVRRLSRRELISTVHSAFPHATDWEPEGLGADGLSELGFSNHADNLLASTSFVEEWSREAELLATRLTQTDEFDTISHCGGDHECAEEVLEKIATKLMRREPSPDDLEQIMGYWELVEAESDQRTAWQWAITALLQHPRVLYRTELGEASPDGTRALTPDELAEQLAFTYSGAPPDAELLALAALGELSKPAVREQQARRLLRTAAGEAVLMDFMEQWLAIDRVRDTPKTNLEGFSPLSRLMTEEARKLIYHVLIETRGSLPDLFTLPYTIANAELAEHYGYEPPAGDGWSIVPMNQERGIGILATGAITAGRSQADKSSPTQRGLFVYERLLCQDVPPPPPNIPAVVAVDTRKMTTRQLWEETHTNSLLCQSCHQEFDPIGFAFEHFDETGRYREHEWDIPIDASGSLRGPDAVTPLEGVDDLANALATDTRVSDCASGLLSYWAFGGAGEQNCLAEEARAAFARGELSVVDYFASLAATPHFERRQTQ